MRAAWTHVGPVDFWRCATLDRWRHGWHWRILSAILRALQLDRLQFLLLFRAAPSPICFRPSHGTWMQIVTFRTIAFLVTMIVNCAALTYLALYGDSPALPLVLDQQFVVLAVWGVLTPTIWGFNARWLPVFAGFQETGQPSPACGLRSQCRRRSWQSF